MRCSRDGFTPGIEEPYIARRYVLPVRRSYRSCIPGYIELDRDEGFDKCFSHDQLLYSNHRQRFLAKYKWWNRVHCVDIINNGGSSAMIEIDVVQRPAAIDDRELNQRRWGSVRIR